MGLPSVKERKINDTVKVLAIVCNYKWHHTGYMFALSEKCDLRVAWSGEGHTGAIQQAIKNGLAATELGRLSTESEQEVRRKLVCLLDEWRPSIVHLLYYYNEKMTAIVREISPLQVSVIFECRDPLTTLNSRNLTDTHIQLERKALEVSDGQIFVSDALRSYYENMHGLELGRTSIIIPHAFTAWSAAPPSAKLSRRDGRVHMALVGSLHSDPNGGRYYIDIIRRLVAAGLVVHSHFHEAGFSHGEYRALAEELADYHYHKTVGFNHGTKLSEIISSYDLMGVFHQLDATGITESATLAVCMPTKAACGWHHGGIPVVCYSHYRGLVEWIDATGIGFVIDRLEAVKDVAVDKEAISRATRACLRHRYKFTHQYNVRLITSFYRCVARDKATEKAKS